MKILKQCWKGEIPKGFYYGIFVIIPKDEVGGVREVGLLEAIHKIISQIINIRLAEKIKFVKDVHGFRRGGECYTAVGEAKLRMQRAACSVETRYQIFLDLRAAYDSINKERVMKILEKYNIWPNIRQYIWKI